MDNARLEAEWLLCEALGLDRVGLYLNFDKPLTPAELASVSRNGGAPGATGTAAVHSWHPGIHGAGVRGHASRSDSAARYRDAGGAGGCTVRQCVQDPRHRRRERLHLDFPGPGSSRFRGLRRGQFAGGPGAGATQCGKTRGCRYSSAWARCSNLLRESGST